MLQTRSSAPPDIAHDQGPFALTLWLYAGLPKNKIKKLSLSLTQDRQSRDSGDEEEDASELKCAGKEAREDKQDGHAFTVVGLDHIVLRARDAAKLEEFYMRVLNCKLEKRNEVCRLS
jgi:hypothetical protein